jgi:N-acetylneuraminic acid mutarotase
MLHAPWREQNTLGQEPATGMASAVIAGRLYVTAQDVAAVNKAAVYDPTTDTWSAIASTPTPRSFASGAAASSRFFVIGGVTSFNRASGTVKAYTP